MKDEDRKTAFRNSSPTKIVDLSDWKAELPDVSFNRNVEIHGCSPDSTARAAQTKGKIYEGLTHNTATSDHECLQENYAASDQRQVCSESWANFERQSESSLSDFQGGYRDSNSTEGGLGAHDGHPTTESPLDKRRYASHSSRDEGDGYMQSQDVPGVLDLESSIEFVGGDVVSRREKEWRNGMEQLLRSSSYSYSSNRTGPQSQSSLSDVSRQLYGQGSSRRYISARRRWQDASRALSSHCHDIQEDDSHDFYDSVTNEVSSGEPRAFSYRAPVKRDPVVEGANIRAIWNADQFLRNYETRKCDIPGYHEHLRQNFDPYFRVPLSGIQGKRQAPTLKPGPSFPRSDVGSRTNANSNS